MLPPSGSAAPFFQLDPAPDRLETVAAFSPLPPGAGSSCARSPSARPARQNRNEIGRRSSGRVNRRELPSQAVSAVLLVLFVLSIRPSICLFFFLFHIYFPFLRHSNRNRILLWSQVLLFILAVINCRFYSSNCFTCTFSCCPSHCRS